MHKKPGKIAPDFQTLVGYASQFMGYAVQACLSEMISRTVFREPSSVSFISEACGLNQDTTRRFFNAAEFLGLVSRDDRGLISPTYSPTHRQMNGSNLLFELERTCLLQRIAREDVPISDLFLQFSPEFDINLLLSTGVDLDIFSLENEGVRATLGFRPYFDPNSDTYAGLWIRNFRKVASRLFTFTHLWDALRTGDTQWGACFGHEVKQPFDLEAIDEGLFQDLMEGMHQANIGDGRLVAERVSLRGVEKVLDIGGASGAIDIALSREFPNISFTIYELDKALEFYLRVYRRYCGGDLLPIIFVPGDFFREIEAPCLSGLKDLDLYDLVLLNWIIHDWQDEQAVTILKKARSHTKVGGRLLLLEAILPESRVGPATLLDLTMLLQTGGKERTQTEYDNLLKAAGFRLQDVLLTATRRQVIVAVAEGEAR